MNKNELMNKREVDNNVNESLQVYKDLFDKIDLGIANFYVRRTGKSIKSVCFHVINPSFEELLQVESATILGKWFPEKKRNAYDSPFHWLISRLGEPRAEKSKFTHFFNSVNRWCTVEIIPLQTDYYGLILTDETEKVNMDTSIQHQLEVLKRVGEHLHVGGFEYDLLSHTMYWSDEMFTIHELDIGEAPDLEQTLSFYTSADRPKLREALKAGLVDGTPFDLELEIITANGNKKQVRIFAQPIFRHNRLVKLGGGILDITVLYKNQHELNQLNRELERSNKELEEFAYVASHDLQEPIRTISAFTELLVTRLGTNLDDKSQMFVEYILGGTSKIKRMINDLLAYSRVNTSKNPSVVFSTQTALENVLELLRKKIYEHNATVTYSSMPEISFQQSLFERLLMNLIDNGLKYNKSSKPKIHIEALESSGFVTFSVKDNGIGIPEIYKNDVFVIFKRFAGEEVQGSGMGLAIAHRIISKGGGDIWYESTEGEGTTFFFKLPKK
ncbi:hypothetical protein GCM10011340_26260 [Roseivirga thermotolerans]|uniref:histidine kinase n=2 Tax=Roseivirga thermotolerans TaxID=1758176 RepID=A0ABQ3I7B9_9BACT|nr:hypothetical protein GCM10011340_26260 [Roseivirga thermotolerans]